MPASLHPICRRPCTLLALTMQGVALVAALFVANLYWGAVHIPATAVTDMLLGRGSDNAAWTYILWDSRLPQAVTATLSGAGLAVAGLLLQTAFRNPLAGPSLLGIDGGANLGVAIVMLALGGSLTAGSVTLSGYVLVILAALVGAMAVMLLLTLLSAHLRHDVMLLIAGVMISYITSSLISLLNYGATEEGVHSFMVWGMGTFAAVTTERLMPFAVAMLAGIAAAIALAKPLNAMLLGENYAANLGINVERTRTMLLLTTGVLTATSTAFCGPIAFVGLAVPHMARLLVCSSDHRALLPATLLIGAALALACNLLSTAFTTALMPINVITPLIGAPVVLYVMREGIGHH